MSSAVDTKTVEVFRGTQRVGVIQRAGLGSVFRYEQSLVENSGGVAFRLPYLEREFHTTGVNLHPFFANLLPEGLRFQALVRKTKTSADDLLSLLITASSDTIGDVRLGSTVDDDHASAIDLLTLGEIDFRQLRKDLLSGRILDENVSGVQAKISASRILSSIRGSRKGVSHLLKLADPDMPLLVENEHACMKLARTCGIGAANTSLIRDRYGVTGLLVDRFDRRPDGSAVHFEDLCQLSNRYPADKYLISVEEAIGCLRMTCTAFQASALEFLRIYAFSYIIGNEDLHAKNVGVIGAPDGDLVRLAPAYDILTTLAYEELDQNRALAFQGNRGRFDRKGLLAMAELCNVPEKAATKMLDTLVSKVTTQLECLDDIGFENALLGRMKREILRRAQRMLPV